MIEICLPYGANYRCDVSLLLDILSTTLAASPPPLSVAEPCKYQSYFFFTFLLYHYIRGKVFAFFF